MKKYFVIILFIFLTSCGKTTSSTGLTDYAGDGFALQIPSTWNVLESNSTLIPKPKDGTIVLVTTSPEVVGGFSNNLVVLKKVLMYTTNSKQFSLLNNAEASSEYFSYKLIENKDINFADGETSALSLFDAQYNASTPKLRFLQLGRVCGTNNSFFLTIALGVNITDTAKYEEILKTFTCK